MCGIAGIVATSDATVDPRALQGMTDRLVHRGPDGAGFMFARGPWAGLEHNFLRDGCIAAPPARVGLGHRRLAILDLSDRGLQPMSTPDGRCWIVFNGEIYNYRELRAALTGAGHTFKTQTDTEALLHAYAEWGDRCLDRLEGMFAFAIWDASGARLFCARDRLGIKPFYYIMVGDHFVFASEIKALGAFPGCVLAPNDAAVSGFLAHGNCDYGDRTLFEGVRALPAGHTLTLEAGDGRVSVRHYWRPAVNVDVRGSDGDRVDEVRSALTATMRKHLISDVRAGSCLSGGLDSSAVVSVMGQLQRDEPEAASAIGDRLFTFTSCYEQKEIDEREYALCVARAVGSEPHLVFPSATDFWGDFERIAWHQDMPFAGLSYYAQWRVMRAAREAGVKVLLDGQGGDEVFGGYAKFRYAYIASLLRRGRGVSAATEIAGMLRQGDRQVLDIRNGSRYLPPFMRRLLNVDSLLQRILVPDWRNATADESTPATRWWRKLRTTGSSGATLMQQIQLDDIVVDTLPQLLRMEDRSSMAFSLEARVPLLDHRLVELGLSLPDHLKVRRGWSKFAVREAMAGVMPDMVRLRRTKLGFAAPDRAWMLRDLVKPVTDLLHSDLRCGRYLDVPALRSWYGSAAARRANTESYRGFFRVLSLEMWMRAYSLS